MCNLFKNNISLGEWSALFGGELRIPLFLAAGEATLSNRPWAQLVYPKYQGLFARPLDPKDPGAGLEPAVGRWGLVPFYHKGPASTFKLSTNNARTEAMATSGTFKFALKDRRCIIPTTAIYEYSGPKGSKTNHEISAAGAKPLFLAGLWGTHTWEGETTESFTMVMQDTREGDDMNIFHNRQPVWLDAAGAATWLDLSADWTTLIASPAPGTLVADPPLPAEA
jgi:putative SOS response-associated peptidase YedK